VKILFVGDVMGKPGRRAVHAELLRIIDEHAIDYVIVNVENSAGGFGITPAVLADFEKLPIDCYSSGNHIWDKRESLALLEQEEKLLRPANYPKGNPGKGIHVGETASGIPVATINLEGQVFMKALRSPFEVADELLEELDDRIKIIFVDFHAEATSEKQAMGFYLDGRVSAVCGTHTHVPTADERILPNGTAFQTDVGMTGPYESVIGMKHEKVLQRFLLQTKVGFEVAKRDVRLAGNIIDVNEHTGRARSIQRLLIQVP